MDYVENAKAAMKNYEDILNDLKLSEEDVRLAKAKKNFDNDVLRIRQIEDAIKSGNENNHQSELANIQRKYENEIENVYLYAKKTLNENSKTDEKANKEDNDYFYDRHEFRNGKKKEEVVEPEENEVVEEPAKVEAEENEVVEEVVEVQDNEEAKNTSKKGNNALRNILLIGGLSGAIIALSVIAAKYGRGISCACANTKDNNENNEKTEATTNNVTTSNDVIVPTTTTPVNETVEVVEVEPEVDYDALIAEAVEKFDGGESTISKEQYEFLLNYANNNLKTPISSDVVIENVINPIMETEFNDTLEALSTANDTYDVGYDIGNYKTSDLVLDNSISKQKLQDLDVLKEALKSEDPEVKEKAAEVIFYILYVINNEVNNSKDTIMINDKEYNGHEINGVKFDKDYQPEFYELNDAADQVIYLTYLNVLSHTAHFTLGEKSWIGAQEYLMGDDGELIPVQAKESFDSILDDMYTVGCDGDDEYNEGYENIYSSVLNASIKENLETLKDKGYVIEESNDEGTSLTLTTNN